mmetsp:Transcript_23083/g.40791  ORF Transcript_23083/g.40791 Transcript_23083/m.40791 type:complete len:201 (+) Transcript_23083:285-887(+)
MHVFGRHAAAGQIWKMPRSLTFLCKPYATCVWPLRLAPVARHAASTLVSYPDPRVLEKVQLRWTNRTTLQSRRSTDSPPNGPRSSSVGKPGMQPRPLCLPPSGSPPKAGHQSGSRCRPEPCSIATWPSRLARCRRVILAAAARSTLRGSSPGPLACQRPTAWPPPFQVIWRAAFPDPKSLKQSQLGSQGSQPDKAVTNSS